MATAATIIEKVAICINEPRGYWYLDIKPSPCSAFKAHSRHPSIPMALAEAERLMQLEKDHAKP